jgi:hypothetical protein
MQVLKGASTETWIPTYEIEALRAVYVKFMVFWAVISVDGYQRFF